MALHERPDTREQFSSHIPALKILLSLGHWRYLSREQCLASRGSRREVILRDELVETLKQRRFEYKGKLYPLSPNAIDQIVRELSAPGLNEGLLTANEKFYNRLLLGITVTEFVDGNRYSPTISLIAWDALDQNSFVVTEELEVLSSDGTHTRRPDLVCYVNGLPLVVIETKRPDSGNPNKNMLDEGISQQIRNQKNDEIPVLFAYAQLLLAVSGTGGRYATTKTPKPFWSKWLEEPQPDSFDEVHFETVKNTTPAPQVLAGLFADKPAPVQQYFQGLWQRWELVTDQDRLLISLLTPARLLDFIRFFLLFDTRIGKIAARYPQFFGIRALIDRVNQRNAQGGRLGGVLWHTTGSGKSYSMVYLCKALLLHPSLKDCRILVITDRKDLEKQLSRTFLASGAFGSHIATRKDGEMARARSGKDLAKRIGQGSERIMFSLINKFNSASRLPECYNPSDNFIVLIDEGHRSQGGENHERMRKALPNAAYIAFTGTPLLKDDKTTNKFGPIVHAYTMQRAVEDGTVTPLLYEERRPELAVNARAIDAWFDRITTSLSEEQKADLKQKFSGKGAIYTSENRIELIAWDIAVHFHDNIKELKLGLKGQVATDSKRSAIRYKKYLDKSGLVTSAVVISPPDTREGHESVDETELEEVQQWWKDNVGHDADEYERKVIDNFGSDGAPDLLIVVDKLLTGFDEPRNTVLYIDKPLKEHNLIQAIARVNRLHEDKQYGLLIDYRGILEELDTSIKNYQDLASHTQCGYDIDDLDGLYQQMGTEYKRLPMLHDRLWGLFAAVDNRLDLQQFRQVLVPEYEEDAEGYAFDRKQKMREDFYQALTDFGMCLKLALSSRSFYEDGSFTEAMISTYKADLRFFSNLRKIARQDAQETVDYSVYEKQISALVDKQVVGVQVNEPEGVYIVGELGRDEDVSDWSDDKARNEADVIRSRVSRTIEQKLAEDPYAQLVFSALLKKAIEEAEALFDHPIKQYALFKRFEEQVEAAEVAGIPASLSGNRHARAYYGILRLAVGEDVFASLSAQEQEAYVSEAHEMDVIVSNAVSEYSLNPKNIEASIRKHLLPRLFKLMGMDKAKDVIDKVIHVTRIGLSSEARRR
ncbi:MAG: HsdR family type I site-specific deoxyribonuclease [Pseudomonadales bacterium]|nr:HsdR family type I site-specific deoxyribonuclease [Pseudomonadales bacterium]